MHKVERAMLDAGFSRDHYLLKPGPYPKWKEMLHRGLGRKIFDWRIQNPQITQVEIQLVSWCNRACSFCPSGTYPVQKLMMERDVVERIISQLEQIRFSGTVGLHLMSEPLLHTRFAEIVSEFRRRLPQVYLRAESNGDVLDRNMKRISTYFESGLNELLINCYDSVEQREDRNTALLEAVNTDSSLWYWNDRQRLPLMSRHKWRVIRLRDFFREDYDSLRNWAGHVDFQSDISEQLDFPLPISCRRPFERCHVNYLGQLLLCNNDWKYEHVIGNLMEQDLHEVWNDPLLTEHYRPQLLACNRDMGLCRTCDAGAPTGHKQPQLSPARPRTLTWRDRLARWVSGETSAQAEKAEAGSGNV